jgi:PAS domain S-box-containing protein
MAERQLYYLQQALQTGTLQIYEQRIRVGDRLQDEEVRVIKSGDDEVLFMVRDIRDRTPSEATLPSSESHYHALMSALPDLIVRINAAGIYQEFAANPSFPVVGDRAELVGTHVVETLPPEVARQRLDAIHQALTTQRIQVYEQDLSEADRLQIEEVRIVPYGPDEVLALVRDISDRQAVRRERQQAEQRLQALNQSLERKVEARTADLRAKEAQIRAMVEAIPDLLIRVTRDGRCLDYLPAADHPPGAGQADGSAGCPPWQPQPQAVERAIATGELQVYEQQYDQAGRLVHQEVRIVALAPDEALVIVRDISTRKQAEANLRASEAKLQAILDCSPAVVFVKDLEGRHTLVNQAFLNVFDCTLDEVIGQTNHGFFPSDTADHLHTHDQWLITHREMSQFEEKIRIGDTDHVFLSNKFLLRDSQGQPYALCGMATDITELKRTEAALQKLSQRLTLALESGAIGCWDWQLDPNTVVWDERMYRLYGLSPTPQPLVTYETWASLVHPDDLGCLEALHQQALSGQAELNMEFRIVRTDGQIRHIKTHGMVVRNAQNQPQSMIGINFDISDRKQAEQALRESQQFLQTVLDNFPMAVFWKDRHSVYLGCNQRFADTTGLAIPGR